MNLVKHFLTITAIYTTAFLVLMYGQLDFSVANFWFGIEHSQWQWRDSFWLKTLFHDDVRKLETMVAIALLVTIVLRWRNAGFQTAKPLVYVFVSALVATVSVNWLKHVTLMDCPWDLAQYGGHQLFHTLGNGNAFSSGQCFPAGHASIGFAWFGVYFLLLFSPKSKHYAGLALGLILLLGFGLGLVQQLRGAHFLSHDITTAYVCWLVALVIYLLMFGKRGALVSQAATQEVQ